MMLMLNQACSVPSSVTPTIGMSVTINGSQDTITPTSLPSKTSTITSSYVPTNTFSPQPSIALTNLPTLSEGLAETQLLQWLKGKTDCQLPCWGGIILGETTWDEAKHILHPIVDFRSINENATCSFGKCDYLEWGSKSNVDLEGYIASSSDRINWVIIKGYPPNPILRLDNILNNMVHRRKCIYRQNIILWMISMSFLH